MLKQLFFLWIICMLPLPLIATEVDTTKNEIQVYDTNYIANYKHYLQIKTVGVNRQSSMLLINNEVNKNLEFSSNNPFSFGLALDYSWISLEYTQTIKGFELNDIRKGKTESQALRLGLYGRKFRGNLYLRNTQGFFLQNIESWVPDWFETNDSYPYSEDLRTRIIAGSLYYNFNHRKFSNAAAFRQSDRQIKSAGTPVLGFLANIEGIYSKTPLVTSDSLVEKFLNISKVQYIKTGVFGGYMHTFSIRKSFFVHGAINQGFMYSFGRGEYHDTEESKKLNALGVSVFFRTSIGYNSDKWFAGTLFAADFFVSDVSSELTSSTGYTYLKIYVGYRFPISSRPWMRKFLL